MSLFLWENKVTTLIPIRNLRENTHHYALHEEISDMNTPRQVLLRHSSTVLKMASNLSTSSTIAHERHQL